MGGGAYGERVGGKVDELDVYPMSELDRFLSSKT